LWMESSLSAKTSSTLRDLTPAESTTFDNFSFRTGSRASAWPPLPQLRRGF
jgi:hypothetical protein